MTDHSAFSSKWTPAIEPMVLISLVTAVMSMHLGMSVPYMTVRLAFVNRPLGTSFRQVLGAMEPGAYATIGVLALALPRKLLMPEGVLALVVIDVAGGTGRGSGSSS